jgi:hypothetical protein
MEGYSQEFALMSVFWSCSVHREINTMMSYANGVEYHGKTLSLTLTNDCGLAGLVCIAAFFSIIKVRISFGLQ